MPNTLHRSSSLNDISSTQAFARTNHATPPLPDEGQQEPKRRNSDLQLRVSGQPASQHRAALPANASSRNVAHDMQPQVGTSRSTTPTAISPGEDSVQAQGHRLVNNYHTMPITNVPGAIDKLVDSLAKQAVNPHSAQQLAQPVKEAFEVMHGTLKRATRLIESSQPTEASKAESVKRFEDISKAAIKLRDDVILKHGMHYDDATVDHLMDKMCVPGKSQVVAMMPLTLFPKFIETADKSRMSPARMVSLATSLAERAAGESGIPSFDKELGWTGDWYAGGLTAKLAAQDINPAEHPGLNLALSNLRRIDSA